MAFKLSEVPGGVRSRDNTVRDGDVEALADGVRLCLVKYDADRGNAGRAGDAGEPCIVDAPCWMEERRLTSGDEGAEVAGERWDGGV